MFGGGDIRKLIDACYETKDVSYGAQTDRYYPSDSLILKVPSSEKGLVSEDALDSNTAILDTYDIPHPDTESARCNLEDLGYSSDTAVVLQERADSVYHDIIGEDEHAFLTGATTVLDTAAANNVMLDTSITNFGKFDDTIKYLDVQDQHSVQNGNDNPLNTMYEQLFTSAALHGTLSRAEAENIVETTAQHYPEP